MRLTLCGSISRYAVGMGAAMHLAGYQALGLPFTYVAFQVTDLAGAITGMKALGIRGCGVSMPYKEDVIPLLDALDPLAAKIGAVNTVVNDDGKLTGHNTDAIGAVRALEEARSLDKAKLLLLGAGGAAKAIAHATTERGAVLTIADRTLDRAKAIAERIGHGGEHPHTPGATAVGLDEVQRAGSYDIVVNATSMGMHDVDPSSPVPEDALSAGQVVMDIVFKPVETALIQAARRRGAIAVHGGRMLLHQAARQFELYTGAIAPLGAMEAALLAQMA